jgi:hypothetical protein
MHGESAAVAINASGWSVGYSCTFPSSYCPDDLVAALWSPTGAGTNLGAVLGPAWSDTVAVGLNNLGDIIGYGDYRGGQYGFLLAPVPEPSTWALLLAGFAGLGLAGYRSARKEGAAVAFAGRTPASWARQGLETQAPRRPFSPLAGRLRGEGWDEGPGEGSFAMTDCVETRRGN